VSLVLILHGLAVAQAHMSFVFSFSPFLDSEAGVKKTAVLMIVRSVKDPQKEFL
jgi:hypothetical protein